MGRPRRFREDDGALLGVLCGLFCVALLSAAVVIDSCMTEPPLMQACEARGGRVVHGAHGGWRCEVGR